jgi:hypothetical protein
MKNICHPPAVTSPIPNVAAVTLLLTPRVALIVGNGDAARKAALATIEPAPGNTDVARTRWIDLFRCK